MPAEEEEVLGAVLVADGYFGGVGKGLYDV